MKAYTTAKGIRR